MIIEFKIFERRYLRYGELPAKVNDYLVWVRLADNGVFMGEVMEITENEIAVDAPLFLEEIVRWNKKTFASGADFLYIGKDYEKALKIYNDTKIEYQFDL